MVALVVDVWVKPDCVEDFIKETMKNHEGSIKEPGNLRFDVMQDQEELSKFTFYELYLSEQAILDHKETSHYLNWRDAVQEMMAQPRLGKKSTLLAPKQ